MKRIICLFFGHKWSEIEVMSSARKIIGRGYVCVRCGKSEAEIKCVIKGCPNHSSQGVMVGKYCSPCAEIVEKSGVREATRVRKMKMKKWLWYVRNDS